MDLFINLLFSLILTVISYMIFPMILLFVNHEKFEKKRANKIALWNSIIVGAVFCIVTIAVSETGVPWNATPAFLYYWINRAILTNHNVDSNKEKIDNSNIKDIYPPSSSSKKKPRIKSLLCTYKKVIIILLIISIALTIVGLIGYNISAGNMRSALNHYDYTFEKCHTAGCGDSNCEYCLGREKQVPKFTNSYGSPYEFPYYSEVSNIRTTFEVIGVISLILTGIFLIPIFIVIIYSRKNNVMVKQHSIQSHSNKRKNKFCRYCGSEINDDSCFCSHCGKKLI